MMKTSMRGFVALWGLWVVGLMVFSSINTGCNCEESVLPPRPAAEIRLEPKNWTISEKDILIIGSKALPIYGKFSISNQAKSSAGQKPLALDVKSIKIKAKSSSGATFKLITSECPKQFQSLTDEEKKKYGCQPTDCVVISNNNPICVKLPLSLPQKLNPGDKPLEFVVEFTAAPDGIVPIADIEIVSNTGLEEGSDKTEEVTNIKILAQSGGAEIAVDVGPGKLKDEASRSRWGYSFPATEEGKTVEQEFTVSNTSQTNLEFSMNWQSGSEDPEKSFEVVDAKGESALQKKFTLAPGAPPMTFKMRFTPKDCSDHTTSLQISSNAIPKDRGEGVLKSARELYIDLRGSSPAQAAVDPNALVFDSVKPGTSAKKTFKISVGDQSLCSLKVYGLSFGPSDPNDPAPKDFTFGDFTKGGQKVDAPTKDKPVSLAKGDELLVEVVYSPKVAGGENGAVRLESNDQNIGNPIVSLTGGTTSTIPPLAVIKFYAGEDDFKSGNDRFKKGDLLKQNEVDMEAKKRVRVEVDGSESYAIPKGSKKIIKYEWSIIESPKGTSPSMTDADKARASFIITEGDPTGRSVYKIQLKVTDEDNLTGTKVVEFKAFAP